MVFSSLLFLFRFLPIVLLAYYILPKKCRNFVLFLSSLVFYAWGEPKYVFLMLFTITMDFFIGKGIDKAKKEGNQKKAKRFLMISILVDLSILGFFKYADFLIGTVNTLTGAGIPLLGIPLPIGISFFTFQTMSYTIDVYKGSTEVQKNWIKYGTYVSMFPQLIAGPIVQYKTIAEQMEHRKENTSDFSEGIHRFMIGLGKKVLIANNIGALWDAIAVLPVDGLAAGTAWLGALSYTMQIYYDFSGYSDMAIGLGRMFGFRFKENFNYPYTSLSVQEFWRRWHISLSSWFKEYVYFPLGGSREGSGKTYRNVFIVFLLTGIWHGANFTFLAWGLLYALLQIIERLFLGKLLGRNPVKPVNWVYTMLAVILGWVLFRSDNIVYAGKYIAAMFGRYNGSAGAAAAGSGVYLCLGFMSMELIIAFVAALAGMGFVSRALAGVYDRVRKKAWFMALDMFVMLGLLTLCILRIISGTYNPFIYFKF